MDDKDKFGITYVSTQNTAAPIRKEVYDKSLALIISCIPQSTAESPTDRLRNNIRNLPAIVNSLLTKHNKIRGT